MISKKLCDNGFMNKAKGDTGVIGSYNENCGAFQFGYSFLLTENYHRDAFSFITLPPYNFKITDSTYEKIFTFSVLGWIHFFS